MAPKKTFFERCSPLLKVRGERGNESERENMWVKEGMKGSQSSQNGQKSAGIAFHSDGAHLDLLSSFTHGAPVKSTAGRDQFKTL